LRNHVAGLDQFSGLAKEGDGQVAATDHGGSKHFGITALKFAARGHRDHDAAFLDPSGGDFAAGRGGGDADEAQGTPAERGDDGEHDGGHQQPDLHFFWSFLSTSTRATVVFGASPVTATSSGLRAWT